MIAEYDRFERKSDRHQFGESESMRGDIVGEKELSPRNSAMKSRSTNETARYLLRASVMKIKERAGHMIWGTTIRQTKDPSQDLTFMIFIFISVFKKWILTLLNIFLTLQLNKKS